MLISDLLGQYYNGQGNRGNRKVGESSGTSAVQRLVSSLRDMGKGTIFEGTINSVEGGRVMLGLSNGQQISARLDANIPLTVGQSMFFQVKVNDGTQIAIRPFTVDGNSVNLTLMHALGAAKLPATGENLSMVNTMMQEQMPIDAASLGKMARLAGHNPDINIQTLVQMQKYGIPVNREMAAQFENYMDDRQAITRAVESFMDELPRVMSNPSASPEELRQMNERILSILVEGLEDNTAESGMKLQGTVGAGGQMESAGGPLENFIVTGREGEEGQPTAGNLPDGQEFRGAGTGEAGIAAKGSVAGTAGDTAGTGQAAQTPYLAGAGSGGKYAAGAAGTSADQTGIRFPGSGRDGMVNAASVAGGQSGVAASGAAMGSSGSVQEADVRFQTGIAGQSGDAGEAGSLTGGTEALAAGTQEKSIQGMSRSGQTQTGMGSFAPDSSAEGMVFGQGRTAAGGESFGQGRTVMEGTISGQERAAAGSVSFGSDLSVSGSPVSGSTHPSAETEGMNHSHVRAGADTGMEELGQPALQDTAAGSRESLGNLLSDGEIQKLGQQLRALPGLADSSKLFQNGGLDPKLDPAELLRAVRDALGQGGPSSGQRLAKLFGSKEFGRLLKNTLERQWMVRPQVVAREGNRVNSLYEKLERQISRMEDVIKASGHEHEPFSQAASDIRSNVEFMNHLNEAYTYVQIPLKMSGQNASGELFVYTNKKSLAQQGNRELTAFLHLDLDNLGSTDVSVRMKDRDVSTDFYLADDTSYALVRAHLPQLEERLKKLGYTCTVSVSNENRKVDFVEDFLKKDQPSAGGRQLHRYSFDMRA